MNKRERVLAAMNLQPVDRPPIGFWFHFLAEQGVLYSGTKEEVAAETRKLVENAGKTGVILGADCTLPATVDINRFGWVVEAADCLA